MPEPGTPLATDPAQPPQAAAGTDPGAGQPPPPPPSAESGIPVTATKPGDPQTAPTRPATPSPQAPAPAPAKPFRPQLDAAGSSRRIHNILNQPPGQRGHANTQADLAVAAKVAGDRVKELQNQPGPLSEEQKQELAACQAALARLQQETAPPPQAADGVPPPQGDNTPPGGGGQAPAAPMSPSQHPPNGDAEQSVVANVEGTNSDGTQQAVAPEIQVLKPELLQQHQENLTRKLAEPRDEHAEALVREQEQRVKDPVTGTQAGRRRIETETFAESTSIGGNHINEANQLKSATGAQVVHKPAAGQVKDKYRAGIEPETTGRREVAASEVTEALGLDLVPPTTMITHGGQPGSAQAFKEGMITGKDASKPPYSVKIDPETQAPVSLPNDAAENWQLIDDLLMHSDRLKKNYMLRLNERNEVVEVALIDNGYSLPANTGVVKKRFPGPREKAPISPANQARLRRMLDNEGALRKSLRRNLEEEALDGLFARARALLARGTYGNFTQDEINAHLPPNKRRKESVHWGDPTQ